MNIDQQRAAGAVTTHRNRLIATRQRAAIAAAGIWQALIPADEPTTHAQLVALESQWLDTATTTAQAAAIVAVEDSRAYVQELAAAAGINIQPERIAQPSSTARRSLIQAIITLRARLEVGDDWKRARTIAEGRARRQASTTIVQASDRSANLAAKASGTFTGWRRITGAQPCGACLAAATATIQPLDEPLGFHLGCRCSRIFLPNGVHPDELSWIPTGQQRFDALTTDQQNALFQGRGGADKAELIRTGKVPLEALIRESHGQAAEQTLDELRLIAKAQS